MCKHGEGKTKIHLSVLKPEEIYMCECGALIDFRDPLNYDDPAHPMSAQQLVDAINELLDAEREQSGNN